MANVVLRTEQFDNSAWINSNVTVTADSQAAPAFAGGSAGLADTLADNTAAAQAELFQDATIPNDGSNWIYSIYVLKDAITSRFPSFWIEFRGGSPQKARGIRFNTSTGAIANGSVGAPAASGVVDDGTWWRVWFREPNNTSGNTIVRAHVFPAHSSDFANDSSAVTGSIKAWGINVVQAGILTDYEPHPFYEIPGGWETLAELGATASSYSDTTPAAGTTYDYRILATNAAGTTASNIDQETATGNVSQLPGVGLAALVGQASIMKYGILMPDQPRPV